MEHDEVYLKHIADAVAAIERYTVGKTETDFFSDEMMQAAVIRQFEVIGEAAKRL